MKNDFALFIGFTGCGYTYYNKARTVAGDYEKLAFVNTYTGAITWYKAPEKIPGFVLLRIEHDADAIASHAPA